MKRIQILKWVGSLLLAGVLLTGLVMAYSGGPFSLERSVFGGSSGMSSGGEFVLRGTAGQVDWLPAKGGEYAIYAGFWQPRAGFSRTVYLPLVVVD